jgi:hypothetical protein
MKNGALLNGSAPFYLEEASRRTRRKAGSSPMFSFMFSVTSVRDEKIASLAGR